MTSNNPHDGSVRPNESELERAFSRGEIEAHFQPKVDVRSARVVGVEALARWAHPSVGLISAPELLPLIEASGQMRTLTERMVEYSTRAAGDWWRSGLGLQVSVNLPLHAFSGSQWNLQTVVGGALSASGLPGEALQFEVTEDGLSSQLETATQALEQLSELGATIAIDDFGTGRFSTRELMRLPLSELKLDRTLIRDLADDEDRIIVRSTIHLAHQMDLQVVAEGVETEEAWRQLRSMGCERAQGFLISKPLPAREVPAWLATWNHRARQLSSTNRLRRRGKFAPSAPAEATA